MSKPIPVLKKIADVSAKAAAAGLEFEPEALALRAADDSAQTWLAKLVERGLDGDAVRVLAGALPKRECVHWALACAKEALAKQASEPQRAALAATELWLGDPSDANRRAAGAASEVAELDNCAGCVALAAYLSGGSLAPPELVPVPPAEHLTALAASTAIQLAAVADSPLKGPMQLKRFVQLGFELAQKPAPWEQPAEPRR